MQYWSNVSPQYEKKFSLGEKWKVKSSKPFKTQKLVEQVVVLLPKYNFPKCEIAMRHF